MKYSKHDTPYKKYGAQSMCLITRVARARSMELPSQLILGSIFIFFYFGSKKIWKNLNFYQKDRREKGQFALIIFINFLREFQCYCIFLELVGLNKTT